MTTAVDAAVARTRDASVRELSQAMETTLQKALAPVLNSLSSMESRIDRLETQSIQADLQVSPQGSPSSNRVSLSSLVRDGADGSGTQVPGTLLAKFKKAAHVVVGTTGTPVTRGRSGAHRRKAREEAEDLHDPVLAGDLIHLTAEAEGGGAGGFLAGDVAYRRCGVQLLGRADHGYPLAFEDMIFRVVRRLSVLFFVCFCILRNLSLRVCPHLAPALFG